MAAANNPTSYRSASRRPAGRPSQGRLVERQLLEQFRMGRQRLATTYAHVLLDRLAWMPYRAEAVRYIRFLAALQEAATDPDGALFPLDELNDAQGLAELDLLVMESGRGHARRRGAKLGNDQQTD